MTADFTAVGMPATASHQRLVLRRVVTGQRPQEDDNISDVFVIPDVFVFHADDGGASTMQKLFKAAVHCVCVLAPPVFYGLRQPMRFFNTGLPAPRVEAVAHCADRRGIARQGVPSRRVLEQLQDRTEYVVGIGPLGARLVSGVLQQTSGPIQLSPLRSLGQCFPTMPAPLPAKPSISS